METRYNSFDDFLKAKRLKLTKPRQEIARIFFSSHRHLSTEDLYEMVRKKYPRIGYATVFRTLKLLDESGLARRVDLGDRIIRFEHKLGHPHHDHLVCTECGKCIEAVDPEIEKLQERLAKKLSFNPISHKMEIFGICKDCRKTRN